MLPMAGYKYKRKERRGMAELINALIPFVELGMGVSLFLGICSALTGYLLNAFTGRVERGRFF